MRQTALIILLAQIGSFVPAKQAQIPIHDQIYVRSGAADAIADGMSTFMVEMVETAYILRHASQHSFIVMDEIGRGTSTADGRRIASSIMKYILEQIRARCMFATHYHGIENEYQHNLLHCYQTEIIELDSQLVLSHRIIAGAAKQSYGFQVAKNAGIPSAVVTDAMQTSPASSSTQKSQKLQQDLADTITSQSTTLLHQQHIKSIEDQLRAIDIAHTTPLEALQVIDNLQQQLSKKKLSS